MKLAKRYRRLCKRYFRVHQPAVVEFNNLMRELTQEWEFIDHEGNVTHPWSDAVIAADWARQTIVDLQAIMNGDRNAVDRTRCPIKVVGWLSWVAAQFWLADRLTVVRNDGGVVQPTFFAQHDPFTRKLTERLLPAWQRREASA